MEYIKRPIKGMDISTLIEQEECGAVYYDDGKRKDLFRILSRYGVDSIRLRLWNDPYDEKKNPYGAGTCDLKKVIALAKRAKNAGMTWLLDFHYSDFWADPGKQYPPKAWKDYDASSLEKAVYDYTQSVLLRCIEEEVPPFMVQVGNEITNGMLWPLGHREYNKPEDAPKDYFNPALKDLLNAGIKAVRDTLPEAIVMLHLDNGGNNELYRNWFDGYFKCGGADFDVIGLSYYPFWHGRLGDLSNNMNDIALRYHKELVVDEVSMGYTTDDYASYEGLTPDLRKGMATKENLLSNLDFPMTPLGQCNFMIKINDIIDSVPDNLGKGYYYWEPAWIPRKGCGWATDASLEYIHDKGPCGNEWANQALFDYDGVALPALKV